MRALELKEFSEPSSLLLRHVADPRPGPDEVVIRMVAAGVNFPDVMVVRGTYQNLPGLPFIPGKEAAGVVESVGLRVRSFSIGDRVLAVVDHGAFADRVVAAADRLVRVPDGVDLDAAAAVGLTGNTAWLGLHRRARLKPGETVLVTGAGGGVGSAGVQLAKAHGATVIAVARDAERAEVARRQGADHVLTGGHEALRAQVLDRTEGRGADVVLESVGGDMLSQVIRATAWEGRVVVVGFASGGQNLLKPGHLLVKNISVIGLQSSDYAQRDVNLFRQSLEETLALVDAGRFDPAIDRAYPLAEIGNALGHMARGGVRGKIIVTAGG